MGSRNTIHSLKGVREYKELLFIFVFSYILFKFAYLFQEDFHRIMDVASYLTWHNIFEVTAVVVSFSVFVVAYYTYDQTQNLRFILLGNIFLIIGMIDFFHTLSFKGMPAFFVENVTANRATTFWIISRLVGSAGLVLAACVPVKMTSNINKRLLLALSVIFSLISLIVVTYYPEIIPPMFIEGIGLTRAKIVSEYIIVMLFAIAMIKFIIEYRQTQDRLTISFCGALLFSIFSEFAFISYNRVYDIYNYLGHIYKFIAFFIIFRVIYVFNVQKPCIELSKARDDLKRHIQNLDEKVRERTRELELINQRLIDDLEYAKDIQKAMLPSRLPQENEVSFDARYYPAERVSGDFYDIFKLDDQNIGLYIGDVSGHGVPAAMLTIFLNQSIKSIKDLGGNDYQISKPSDVLKTIYKSFNETNFKDEVYMVLLYAVYNFKTRELTYASAGMNVQPLLIKDTGVVREIDISGFPICKFLEFYAVAYRDTTIKLDPGDKVLFYTDGLIEAENSSREYFSVERLMEIAAANHKRSNHMLSEIITNNVFEYIGDKHLKDDITFFVMQVN